MGRGPETGVEGVQTGWPAARRHALHHRGVAALLLAVEARRAGAQQDQDEDDRHELAARAAHAASRGGAAAQSAGDDGVAREGRCRGRTGAVDGGAWCGCGKDARIQ